MRPSRSPLLQTAALKFLYPTWFSIVMGLAGLALAWHRATLLMGDAAGAAGMAISVLAALVYAALLLAAGLRARLQAQAWRDDLKHPVRHSVVAALPIGLLLLATAAVGAGLRGPWVQAAWWVASLSLLGVTLWVTTRWWAGQAGLPWASVTPALLVPIVGNVLVPLAGVPLGQPEWSAAQFGIGLLFWPVVLALLVVRIATQGMWPERLLPASFILLAPPAVAGLSAPLLGAPPALAWVLWGMAMFSLLWVGRLAQRIVSQPFGLAHWGISFPLAALTTLTLQLGQSGPMAWLGVALLALTSVVVAGLALATVHGLRSGSLLQAEAVPISVAPPGAG